MIPASGTTGDMLFDSAHFSLGKFLQGIVLHHHNRQVGHGFTISHFFSASTGAPVILLHESPAKYALIFALHAHDEATETARRQALEPALKRLLKWLGA